MHKTKFTLLIKQFVKFFPHDPGCPDRKIVYSGQTFHCIALDLVVGCVGL